MSKLSWNEAKILRAARDVMFEKPDETLTYLAGTPGVTDDHLIAMALRAQLEQLQRAQTSMRVTTALVAYLKGRT